jgi:hypothetical protein
MAAGVRRKTGRTLIGAQIRPLAGGKQRATGIGVYMATLIPSFFDRNSDSYVWPLQMRNIRICKHSFLQLIYQASIRLIDWAA